MAVSQARVRRRSAIVAVGVAALLGAGALPAFSGASSVARQSPRDHGAATPPPFTTYTRIYGATADATAAAELQHQFPSGSCPGVTGDRPVVVATDATYPDALASAYLAGALGTGTLLTSHNAVSGPTLSAIKAEGITKVDIVGGPLAVTTAVVAQLESMDATACGGGALGATRPIAVTRIWGTTEYTTAEKIAVAASTTEGLGTASFVGAYAGTDTSGGTGRYNDTAGLGSAPPASTTAVPTAIVATGTGFQDAESASTLAYAERFPILLTTPTRLSSQVASAISALGIRQVIVMGGQDAVSDAVVSSLEGLGISALRIAGSTYSGTSTELASFEAAGSGNGLSWTGTGGLTVARGDFFTDGLAGAVVGADGPGRTAPEPLVLTKSPGVVGVPLATFLTAAGTTGIGGANVTHFTVLGGALAVTQTTINEMGADLTGAHPATPPAFTTTTPLKSPNPATHPYVPPSNPPSNTPQDPTLLAPCIYYTHHHCMSSGIKAIDNARATEDLGPMVLPTNFTTLTTLEQLFVITDIERTSRGEAPVRGLSELLDSTAQVGANATTDPAFSVWGTLHTPVSGGSNWAGVPTMLYAHYLWMYDDGPGGSNLDCRSPTTTGCWGHRDNILIPYTNVVMGAAKNASGNSFTEIFVAFASPTDFPTLYYTWTDALAAGAAP
jgi:putative cell wall-binding protein